MEVVVEFGVPLRDNVSDCSIEVVVTSQELAQLGTTHGTSDGVTGSEGGGGRLMRVGTEAMRFERSPDIIESLKRYN